MTTISLREYLNQINDLIDLGNNKEAIFHCTNILKSYPKCVGVYQLLGKSLLESDQLSEAMDVFSKVLTVLPDDFSAHAGLSEIYEKNQQLDKAIWHLERSFETQPSNLLIQDELKRLFAARDGVPPSKIRLTRGALIRMYAKGELYQQAIAESQSILEGDGERLDIKLLLAKMFHASGSSVEAAETCGEILDEIPYCFEANSIMHEIELARGEAHESSSHVTRMTEVDPYFGFIDEAHQTPLEVLADTVILDKPDYDGTESDDEIPEWARQIGINLSGTQQPLLSTTDVFTDEIQIIEEHVNPAVEENIPFHEAAEDAIPEPLEPPDVELPDWIAKAGWIRATEDETPPPAVDQTSIDNKLSEPELAMPADDLPDWLKSLTPVAPSDEEPTSVDSRMPDFSETDLKNISSISTDEINEMLNDNFSVESLPEKEHTVVDEILNEETDSEELNLADVTSINAEEIPDLPDWLRDSEISSIDSSSPEDSSEEWVPSFSDSNAEISDLFDESVASLSQFETLEVKSSEESAIPAPESFVGKTEIPDEIPLPSEQSLDEMIDDLNNEVLETPVLSSEVLRPLDFTESKSVKPEVPAWVQQILGKPGVTPPVTSPKQETDITDSTEDLEPLITDLKGEVPEEGAISDDVNQELMSWLTNINPDDALEEKQAEAAADQMEIVTPVSQLEEMESHEISFDQLSDASSVSESNVMQDATLSAESEQIPALEENIAFEIDDRLSSLLDKDVLSSAELTAVETVSPPAENLPAEEKPHKGVIKDEAAAEKLLRLLGEKKYNDFSKTLAEKPIEKELLDAVNDQALLLANDEPESFDLWKTIGDINLKKSDSKQALEAYKKAENLIYR